MELYEDESYNFKTFECVPHPYWMPHFENAFDVSVHLMMKQILIWIKKNIAKVREEAAKRRRRSSLIVGDTEKFAYCTRTNASNITPSPPIAATKSDTHLTAPPPSRSHSHSHSHSHSRSHSRGGRSSSSGSGSGSSGSGSPVARGCRGGGGAVNPSIGAPAPTATTASASTTSTTVSPTKDRGNSRNRGDNKRGGVSSGSSSPTSSPTAKCVVSDSEETLEGWGHKKQQRRRHSCDIGHGVPAIEPSTPDSTPQDSSKEGSDSDTMTGSGDGIVSPSESTQRESSNVCGGSKKIVIRGSGSGTSMSSPGSPTSTPSSPSPSYTSTMVSMFSNINKQTQKYSNEDTMASVNVIPRGITTSRKNEFLEQQKRNMEYLHIPGLEMQQIQELLQGIRSKSKEQLLNKASATYKREEVFDAARTYDQENERRPPVEELKRMFDRWSPTKYEFMYRDSNELVHTSSSYSLSTTSSKFAFNIFQNTGVSSPSSSSSSSSPPPPPLPSQPSKLHLSIQQPPPQLEASLSTTTSSSTTIIVSSPSSQSTSIINTNINSNSMIPVSGSSLSTPSSSPSPPVIRDTSLSPVLPDCL